ncbi:Uncharacterized protein dnm_007690 [Desulfonema magnum]|uniref:Uncharacterized protein n=1 Tax=Desulfonema magnum TaxID=45655 RepID=A0A975BFG3_9BACT|nr:Uncharacterized protein dnm_007690 [Desulfonema magnum]
MGNPRPLCTRGSDLPIRTERFYYDARGDWQIPRPSSRKVSSRQHG